MLRRPFARRRCTECRRWYRPSAQTAHNQKTCGRGSCRRVRRARLERHRRSQSLPESRLAERERQRESRRRRRTAGPSPPVERPPDGASAQWERGPSEGMSLSGLELEVAEMMEETLKNWDTVFQHLDAVSLAGLRFQLVEILEKSGHFVGQAGPETLGCHWPARFCNQRETRGKSAGNWDTVSPGVTDRQ